MLAEVSTQEVVVRIRVTSGQGLRARDSLGGLDYALSMP